MISYTQGDALLLPQGIRAVQKQGQPMHTALATARVASAQDQTRSVSYAIFWTVWLVKIRGKTKSL